MRSLGFLIAFSTKVVAMIAFAMRVAYIQVTQEAGRQAQAVHNERFSLEFTQIIGSLQGRRKSMVIVRVNGSATKLAVVRRSRALRTTEKNMKKFIM